nr:phage antirepressor N-terminal domain-containing protein [Diaphorobacter sp. HDW4B]
MSNSTQVQKIITISFHGAELFVVEHDGQPYTPMKVIVAAMGLDWASQFRKVSGNDGRWGVLELRMPASATIVDSTTVGSADGKSRGMMCIPVRKVAAWLTTIEPGKIKNPEVRARVIQYQNECDDVLWQYWNEGIAINPRQAFAVNPGDVLTKEEAETLRLMLKSAADRVPKSAQGPLMMQGWSKLKAHFKVSYREIPRHEFSEAVSIIARHTAEWEVVDDEIVEVELPNAELLKSAFALATQVATEAARTAFAAMLEGKGAIMDDRWMFSMARSRDGKIEPWAALVEPNAMVVSMNDLPGRILEPNGMITSDAQLANLARRATNAVQACVAANLPSSRPITCSAASQRPSPTKLG